VVGKKGNRVLKAVANKRWDRTKFKVLRIKERLETKI
jgi:hypothetical protein